MFQPASLKGGSPTPVDERFKRKFIMLYLFIILSSFIPGIALEFIFIKILWNQVLYWIFLILLPLNVILFLYTIQITSLLTSWLALKLVNIIHYPKEGIFMRDPKDKDYYFWNLRNIVKKWPLYITASNPLPWLKYRFTLRFYGVKIGCHCICDNSWLSSEFLKIGRNVILGMGSTALTFGIEQDKFLLKKIVMEDNVLVGAKCVLMPGTTIQSGVRLSAHSYTDYNTILETDKVYKGHPARKIE
jgi:acetyltransferase-like isoleucine patch superfamily enzyme